MIAQELQLIVLQPQGRLDLKGGKGLEKQMASLVPQPQHLWVFDLSQVDFMDSSGLFALITGLKVARNHSCRLVLCNLQAPVRLVFELTQLDSVFEIYENYDAILTTVNTPVLVA